MPAGPTTPIEEQQGPERSAEESAERREALPKAHQAQRVSESVGREVDQSIEQVRAGESPDENPAQKSPDLALRKALCCRPTSQDGRPDDERAGDQDAEGVDSDRPDMKLRLREVWDHGHQRWRVTVLMVVIDSAVNQPTGSSR
jgi:hypothetical protein